LGTKEGGAKGREKRQEGGERRENREGEGWNGDEGGGDKKRRVKWEARGGRGTYRDQGREREGG